MGGRAGGGPCVACFLAPARPPFLLRATAGCAGRMERPFHPLAPAYTASHFTWRPGASPPRSESAGDGPHDSAATYLAACRRHRVQPDVTFRQRLGEAHIGLVSPVGGHPGRDRPPDSTRPTQQHHTMGPAQGRAIGEALAAEGAVESLDLRDNSLGDGGVTALASALERVKGLRSLSLDGTCPPPPPVVCPSRAAVTLPPGAENGVTGSALPAVARCTAASPGLRSLSLAHNALGARCGSALVAVVRSARAVTVLQLGHCALGPACGVALADALSRSSTPLQRLDLQWNNLGPRGTRALAGALEEGAAPSLRALDLSFNGIDDSAPHAVASLLHHPVGRPPPPLLLVARPPRPARSSYWRSWPPQALARLDLSSNRLGHASVEALAAELYRARVLRALRVSDRVVPHCCGGGLRGLP